MNCFQISIFVPLRTAKEMDRGCWHKVVNCFQISIFVPLRTATYGGKSVAILLWIAFKLVSLFHYEQPCLPIHHVQLVVNCFQISIFVPLRTAGYLLSDKDWELWIAFKLVSLFHYEQQDFDNIEMNSGCELLSN